MSERAAAAHAHLFRHQLALLDDCAEDCHSVGMVRFASYQAIVVVVTCAMRYGEPDGVVRNACMMIWYKRIVGADPARIATTWSLESWVREQRRQVLSSSLTLG